MSIDLPDMEEIQEKHTRMVLFTIDEIANEERKRAMCAIWK